MSNTSPFTNAVIGMSADEAHAYFVRLATDLQHSFVAHYGKTGMITKSQVEACLRHHFGYAQAMRLLDDTGWTWHSVLNHVEYVNEPRPSTPVLTRSQVYAFLRPIDHPAVLVDDAPAVSYLLLTDEDVPTRRITVAQSEMNGAWHIVTSTGMALVSGDGGSFVFALSLGCQADGALHFDNADEAIDFWRDNRQQIVATSKEQMRYFASRGEGAL